ncbi:MAG: cereblon family protein [Proteobacteria bacterium]|nr:cereblon family protein [Pseudomonadota bacterium]
MLQRHSSALITETQNKWYLLQIPFNKNQESQLEKESDEQDPEKEKYILCAQCRSVITSPRERIEVHGMHQHTFFNPYGIIFQIGCFKAAQGCGYVGPAIEEFSWFPGFNWRVAICRACLTHLGWLFSSPGQDSFHGLILDHLIQPE